jgi:hypothetical protein
LVNGSAFALSAPEIKKTPKPPKHIVAIIAVADAIVVMSGTLNDRNI